MVVVLCLGVALALAVTVGVVRRRVAALRESIDAESTLIGDATPGVEATVRRLATGDSRVLGAALAPVLAADEWIDEDTHRRGDHVWNWVYGALKGYDQFGVAVLARGREWGADAGAAELTGAPAALASALRKLDGERDAPETDLREWERSVAAADILPPVATAVSTGRSRTHPPLADRLEHPERLTRTAESGDD